MVEGEVITPVTLKPHMFCCRLELRMSQVQTGSVAGAGLSFRILSDHCKGRLKDTDSQKSRVWGKGILLS